MAAEADILILEDEPAQILALRSQLKGLGRLVEFTDPEPALDHARQHACDAAIVDVRMPRSSMDGLSFLCALREFDRDLAIIIRTASESDEVANKALELRAIKRAIKSKTTLAELRRSTQEAIDQTRQHRTLRRDAQSAEATRRELAEALGTYDLRLTAADLHRGLIYGLRNQLTALSSLAALLQADAAQGGQPLLIEHGRRCADLASAMIGSVNSFLNGSFGDGSAASYASVNECLGALGQFFRGNERWAAQSKRVILRDLMSDTLVACAPLELTNGLKHLVEFALVRARPASRVSLTAAVVLAPQPLGSRLSGASHILDRGAIRRDHPHVSFRLSAPLGGLSPEEVQAAFATGGGDARSGNLSILSKVLASVRGGLLVERAVSGSLSLDALVPVSV